MISYPFIAELFKNVLEKSHGIQGRFFVCPNLGREMNSDGLGQIIQDLFDNSGLQKKYPLCLFMPPISYGYYCDQRGEWERYKAILFFLNTTYYSGVNQVKAPNAATGTSTHTIPQDWHDMKRCATNFVFVLDKLTRTKGLIKDKLRVDSEREKIITPISMVGTDKASGVRLDLNFSALIGCELEDYNADDISTIIIPADDSHPEHQL